MNSKSYISAVDYYKQIVIQIATPYSVGTGFYLADYDLIVTNEHLVRDNRDVVVDGICFERQLVEVLYLDDVYDLAFLKAPKDHNMPKAKMKAEPYLTIGEQVISLGRPLGRDFQSKEGEIDAIQHENDTDIIAYYEHSALLSPGNSGGPLFDYQGYLVGVNTFLIRSGNEVGFSLPLSKLKESLEIYNASEAAYLVKCSECRQVIEDPLNLEKRCTNCGSKITYISNINAYEPIGINKQIEDMLIELGHDGLLARRGPYNWEIEKGSALIHVTYHEKSGLITGDAYLCQLPDDDVLPLYTYLLRANYKLEGLTFTFKDNEVLLSLLIFDQYLNKFTALRLFQHLFEMADYYDNILIDDYNAKQLTLLKN